MDYLEPFRNIVCPDWICLSAEVHFFLPTLDHGYPMVSFVSKWKQFGVCVCVRNYLFILGMNIITGRIQKVVQRILEHGGRRLV